MKTYRLPSPAPAWQHVPPGRANTQPFGDSRVTAQEAAAGVVADASGVVRVHPAAVVRPVSTVQVREALARAVREGRTVTVAGTRHSGGGQSLQDGALLLDMRAMDGLHYDPATQTIDVQPGATWEQVQRFLDTHGRAVAVQQSSNVFSVGGSIATNVHGRDVRFGPLADSIESVTVMLADGSEVRTSPTERPELFALVVGGFGQVGVITQARLRTVPNEQYDHRSRLVSRAALPATFAAIAHDAGARLLQVRLPVSRAGMFDAAYAIEYRQPAAQPPALAPLRRGNGGLLDAVIGTAFRGAIYSDLAKRALWQLQTRLEGFAAPAHATRNEAMSPSAEFLRSGSHEHLQVLQEHFVPLAGLDTYLRSLEHAVRGDGANLLNVTLRWTPAQRTHTALPYAPDDRVAAVLYLDQRPGPAAQAAMDRFTRDAAQAAVDVGGSFYLPYQLSAFTPQQVAAAYPHMAEFFAGVHRYDPGDVFHNALDALDPAPTRQRAAAQQPAVAVAATGRPVAP